MYVQNVITIKSTRLCYFKNHILPPVFTSGSRGGAPGARPPSLTAVDL